MSQSQPTWSRAVRWFHWINLLLFLLLVVLGTIILNASKLDVSNNGKILLKTLHVLVGYAFALNLLVRFALAFSGPQSRRWSSLIPSGREIKAAFREQLPRLWQRDGHRYTGHSPIGKISIALMLLCMTIMACTGLVLAGTDIFYPPFGAWIAQTIAASGVDPAMLVPYQPELYDPVAYEAMRAWRGPLVDMHVYTFYTLLVLFVIHLAGVVMAELKGGQGLVSAMITGHRKDTDP